MQNNPVNPLTCPPLAFRRVLRIQVQTICGFEYNAAGTSYSLVQFPFSEGRVLPKGGGLYGYEYFMKDHLGNVRLSFEPAANNNITLTQEDYYYPFGLRVPIVDQAASKNRYLYIRPLIRFGQAGKELVEFEGLNWYDYGLPPEQGGARWYNPQLGSLPMSEVNWHVVNLTQDKYSACSPYNYCLNNPINSLDKTGEEPTKSGAGTIQILYKAIRNYETQNAGKSPAEILEIISSACKAGTFFQDNPQARYIYTTEEKWIDTKHFFKAAELGNTTGSALLVEILGVGKEFSQIGTARNSIFSYEDVPSNRVGAEFGANSFNHNMLLSRQVRALFASIGAAKPTDAPNWDQLPSVERGYGQVPKNFSDQGAIPQSGPVNSDDNFYDPIMP